MNFRTEKDSMGEIKVPEDKLWGAQTQRSFQNFKIGKETMPEEVIKAIAIVKKAAALANCSLGKLSEEKCGYIVEGADEILKGNLYGNFPLVVWQTGSGTQTNMNVNEVIANFKNLKSGKKLLHPNDDVNMSQSSNDVFPTAMHIAAVLSIEDKLIPAVERLAEVLDGLEKENRGIVKVARTHVQDAVPISFAQEISGFKYLVKEAADEIRLSLVKLYPLALGGTAVGTGLNAPDGFSEAAVKNIAEITGKPFIPEENKFHALSAKDGILFAHGALKTLAVNLFKIATDVKWLASGPRCGLGEIEIPFNEPGSSIMPGKVNPTQCEAVSMVAIQVMGNDAAVTYAASQGNFQLNAFMPVIIYNFLQSVNLLTDVTVSFTENCVKGIKPNRIKMKENLSRSLMTVTGLSTVIGYDASAKVAKKAHAENLSLKEACLSLGFLDEKEFDALFRPEDMAKEK